MKATVDQNRGLFVVNSLDLFEKRFLRYTAINLPAAVLQHLDQSITLVTEPFRSYNPSSKKLLK